MLVVNRLIIISIMTLYQYSEAPTHCSPIYRRIVAYRNADAERRNLLFNNKLQTLNASEALRLQELTTFCETRQQSYLHDVEQYSTESKFDVHGMILYTGDTIECVLDGIRYVRTVNGHNVEINNVLCDIDSLSNVVLLRRY